MRWLTSIRAAPAGALAIVAAAGLGGCISTATYGTGEAPETTLLNEATGGILEKLDGKEAPQIDYEPRAPLVIPPSAQLPPPAPAPAQVAGAAWPTDADQVATDGSDVAAYNQARAITPDYARRLKPLAGVMSRAEGKSRRRYQKDPAKAFLAEKDRREEFEAALAEAEGLNSTERRFLTDPPSQYRQPAESAPAQFKDIKKDGNFFTRLFGG